MVESSSQFQYGAGVTECLADIHNRKCCWVVLRIPEGTDSGAEIQNKGVSAGDDEADFANLKAELTNEHPRWVILDLHYVKNEVNNNKVLFVAYTPDGCTKMSTKFAYANHKEKVKSKITVAKELQINDIDDFDRTKFIEEM